MAINKYLSETGKGKHRGLPKRYKWKAKPKGTTYWHYFTAKSRARKFVGTEGQVSRR